MIRTEVASWVEPGNSCEAGMSLQKEGVDPSGTGPGGGVEGGLKLAFRGRPPDVEVLKRGSQGANVSRSE
jgi:hypothetical protein